jgi:DNA gyrase/topoisomerase IV subunit B
MAEEKEIKIKLLEFPECVREKVGMYVGGADDATVIFREIIDNSMDEAYSSSCDNIYIHQNFNGFHFVADNGRGLPITMSEDKPDQTQASLAVGSLHAGSKFDGSSSGDAKIGTNGVGSSCTNALSNKFVVLSKVNKDNYNKSIPEVESVWNSYGPRSKNDIYYYLEYNKGYKVKETAGKLHDLEAFIFGKNYKSPLPEGYSTYVLFQPDDTIFDSVKSKIPVRNLEYFMLIQDKFYKKNVNVTVNGQSITGSYPTYKYEVCKTITPADTSFNKKVGFYMTFEVDPNLGGRDTSASCNGLCTDQGHHVQIAEICYKDALVRNYNITHNYLLNGLKMVVVVLCQEAVFDSQTKVRLKSIVKVKSSDFEEVTKEIMKVFRSDPDYWDLHAQRLNAYAESMVSLSTMDRIKKDLMKSVTAGSLKGKAFLPDKLSDATAGSKDRMNCELFICEGDSAAGALKSGRKTTLYHAVMSLRGKTLNTINKNVEQMMDNKELNTIFTAIGLGVDDYNIASEVSSREEKWDIIKKHARYGKIIISTDADPDGAAIAASILSTLGRFSKFLIEFGMVYIIEAPLYEQNGKFYFTSDQRNGIIPGFDQTKPYQRFKGLGEMSRTQVYDAFYDGSKRRLTRVTTEGLEAAQELVRSIEERKRLLTENGILTNPYNLK